MKPLFTTLFVTLSLAAGSALADPEPLDPFPGKGIGFGGFVSAEKPGKGIPGGKIHTKRSPTAIANLLKIFGTVSTVATVSGTK